LDRWPSAKSFDLKREQTPAALCWGHVSSVAHFRGRVASTNEQSERLLLCCFLDAGQLSARVFRYCRHPKTSTEADLFAKSLDHLLGGDEK
jgi:hypothetical protein